MLVMGMPVGRGESGAASHPFFLYDAIGTGAVARTRRAPLQKTKRRNVKRTTVAALALLVGGFTATSVSAHPTLKSTMPPAEGVVASAPSEIRLSFSEAVIPKFSTVHLKDQAGKSISSRKVAINPND